MSVVLKIELKKQNNFFLLNTKDYSAFPEEEEVLL